MVISAKGKSIDLQSLAIANSQTVALGNANMNARGDLLGKNGKVVKTAEELANEYNTSLTPDSAVEYVGLSKDIITKTKQDAVKTEAVVETPKKK